jgi:hypothetical protein
MQRTMAQPSVASTPAAAALSTMWMYAQLGQLCEASGAKVWPRRAAQGSNGQAPLLQAATERLTRELEGEDLSMNATEAGAFTPAGTALRHALELVPILWSRFECVSNVAGNL